MSPTELMFFEEAVEDKAVMGLKALEEEHSELEMRLAERREALNLQLSVMSDGAPSESEALRLLSQTHASEVDVRAAYLSALLNAQINVEDYLEMKGHISNYEIRIAELRNNLIDKEAEIAY